MRPKPNYIFIKGCLMLAIAIATNSKKDDDTLETKSIDSGSPDSWSLEDRGYYEREGPYLEMRGNLRQSMAYHVMLMDTHRSCVSSPLSALLSLGKLAIGSSSRRYQELKEVIGYKRKKIRRRFKEIMDHLTHMRGKFVLTIASRMYVSHKETISSKFSSAAREVFKSGCERADFNDPRGTAMKINSWVDYETKGMIRKIIDPSKIPSTTSLIIINAVYFKGSWKNTFESAKRGTFYASGRQKEIQMMSTKGYYNYFSSNHLKAQILEIPYAGKGISMIIILPFDKNGLPAVLHWLANLPEGLNSYMKQMSKTFLRLTIPKFRVATDLPMDRVYKEVGLREIFKPDGKVLTKIVKGHSVYVTGSYQSAVLEVDECGSDGGVASSNETLYFLFTVHPGSVYSTYIA